MGVIYAHWNRQLKSYLRSGSRIISSIVQPIFYLMALGFGLGRTFEQAGQGNYVRFLAPAMLAMIILFSAFFSGIELLYDRRFGFLRATMVAPVSRFSIMLGRTMGGATVAWIQGVLVFIFCTGVGYRPVNLRAVPLALLIMALIAIMFAAMGTLVGSLFTDFSAFQTVTNFLAMPFFFFSGALFPLTNAPRLMVWGAMTDPFAYGVDALRAVLNGTTVPFGLGLDLAVLAILTSLSVIGGAYLFSRIEL
jgi:ABC-2 type transport system permease protein